VPPEVRDRAGRPVRSRGRARRPARAIARGLAGWLLVAGLLALGGRPPAEAAAPPPGGPAPRDAVRALLDAYERAIATRDLRLLRQIYPAADVDRIRAALEGIQSQSVSLSVESLDVSGDRAVVRGRRIDVIVPAGGREVRSESHFVFRLRRAGLGWVIDAIGDPPAASTSASSP